LAYSHKALADKGPCLQAESISFASRYTYVTLGAPAREVRAHSRESGASYRLYLLTCTLANASTIRRYLVVVGCAEERLKGEYSVLSTILASMKLP
jgi:hypothetical protein